jgi:aerobic-type carbon monoxide dehydrogenase small subunit (CoxS/CutS family)
MALQLSVNKKTVSVDVAPDTPLLWVLRDSLGYHGPKYGCGVGLCGACTVHVDGRAARSCTMPVSSAVGKSIVTIEGLSLHGDHPVQKAWQEIDVAQCGYCQSGQIMTAVALLEKTPHPTDAQIDATMSNSLCRCGTYTRIRQAIHKAAGDAPVLEPASDTMALAK